MNIIFIGEDIGKFGHLVKGGTYLLKENYVWVVDGDEDSYVTVIVTAEEAFKFFELA